MRGWVGGQAGYVCHQGKARWLRSPRHMAASTAHMAVTYAAARPWRDCVWVHSTAGAGETVLAAPVVWPVCQTALGTRAKAHSMHQAGTSMRAITPMRARAQARAISACRGGRGTQSTPSPVDLGGSTLHGGGAQTVRTELHPTPAAASVTPTCSHVPGSFCVWRRKAAKAAQERCSAGVNDGGGDLQRPCPKQAQDQAQAKTQQLHRMAGCSRQGILLPHTLPRPSPSKPRSMYEACKPAARAVRNAPRRTHMPVHTLAQAPAARHLQPAVKVHAKPAAYATSQGPGGGARGSMGGGGHE